MPVLSKADGGIVYAEQRVVDREPWLRSSASLLAGLGRHIDRPDPVFIAAVRANASKSLTAASFRSEIQTLLATPEHEEQGLIKAFGAVVAAAKAELSIEHYDVQIAAGRALYQGKLIEMQTGEGKTLAATLPAAAVALSGRAVHVVTTNDYLAERDAATLAPLYARLGLSVGAIAAGMNPTDRQSIYANDIVYCSAKELGFDYLKDRIALKGLRSKVHAKVRGLIDRASFHDRLLLRGLHFAIIDEADSVLIDEARTPLIISAGQQAAGAEGEVFIEAIDIARQLELQSDCRVQDDAIRLNEHGRQRVEQLCQSRGGIWRGPRRREGMINRALLALHNYRCDYHYLVRDDALLIIDENTGRVHPDRAWEHGLQQLIEAKEAVTVTAPREVLARISYQRFFRRFDRLAGMTGTGRQAAVEFKRVYDLSTVCIPTHRPVRRRFDGVRVMPNRATALSYLVARLCALQASARPVLIGTRSVAASEILSAALTEAQLAHRVLSAKQDEDEAQVVASAGQRGAITVATSMAGRGTDIELGAGVAALGGLHVICFEHHDASRIDQQLQGRCARQGDPGSYEVLLSLDDELAGTWPRHLCTHRIGERLLAFEMRRAQRRVERTHARARRALESMDERMDDILAFVGTAQ